jgi:uncharacterized membrane protein YeaQ/YmgE (transglycosylase-associated protein family)
LFLNGTSRADTRSVRRRSGGDRTRNGTQEDIVIDFIIFLIVGGIIGWLASIVMRTDGQQGIILNIVVGIIGSFIGGVLFGPTLGGGGIYGWLSAFLGAIVLLAIVNLIRRGSVR